ncbi:MAG: CPBP family intramembrane metalloprotease [Candidatus Bathyarchaeota archaeon]|nr:MAG: CPBP family intramembrane metalloprotease [Candidatus Bathyarchaeota archaeon]
MNDNKNEISPLSAILAIVMTFFLILFLGGALTYLFGYAFALIIGELLIIIIPMGYLLSKEIDIKKYIGFKITSKNILLGLAFGAVLFLLDLVISNLLVSIIGPSDVVSEANQIILDISKSPQGLLFLTIALSLAGICEEFTFRGFLQTSVNSRHSFGAALITSSLAFGFFHFDPQALYTISAFLLGLFLGYIYHRWNSYVISTIAHVTLNLIVLVFFVFLLG